MEAGQRLELLESHNLFAAAKNIADRLKEKGFHTVLAGGCVRDSLLGLRPKDMDLATSAPPDAIESAFERTLAVGKAFGTIVVVEGGHNFEVTTFRSDGPYKDGRHPSHIEFSSIEEDAKRRDFTINALFYDFEKGVLDYTGGLPDLKAKVLRAVGDARSRFQEDRLRMLRAVRFSAQLGFAIDPKAMSAIQEEAPELKLVSVERIFNETKRLLESKYRAQGLAALMQSKLYEVYWPELRGFDPKSLERFEGLRNWENVFAAIATVQGVQDPEPRLRAWKVSKEGLKRVQLQLQAMRILKSSTVKAERVRALGSEVYAEILALASGLFPADRIAGWLKEYTDVAAADGSLPKPFLTGDDVKKAGVAPGEGMGRVLKEVFDAQLEGRVRTRKQALEYIAKIKV